MATLRITTGPAKGRSFECDRELVIGREHADLVVNDPEMSRRHAVVRPLAAGVEIEDLGSLNGTFVDGRRISGAETVTKSAALKLGTTQFSVEIAPSRVPIPPVADKTVVRVRDRTVVRDARIVPVPDATVVRDQPVLPVTETTTVRDVPAPRGPPAVPSAPGQNALAPGGPPGAIPAPIRLLTKSRFGRRLLGLLIRLRQRRGSS